MFLMIRPPGRPKEVVLRCDATIQGDMLLVTHYRRAQMRGRTAVGAEWPTGICLCQ
jgi:hypothetical protein